MWRKPVGEGAKRVTTGVVIWVKQSHTVDLGSAPVQGMAAAVTQHYLNAGLPPSLTCRDHGRYSKIGPLLGLRVWAGCRWNVFSKVDPLRYSVSSPDLTG